MAFKVPVFSMALLFTKGERFFGTFLYHFRECKVGRARKLTGWNFFLPSSFNFLKVMVQGFSSLVESSSSSSFHKCEVERARKPAGWNFFLPSSFNFLKVMIRGFSSLVESFSSSSFSVFSLTFWILDQFTMSLLCRSAGRFSTGQDSCEKNRFK